MDYAEYEALLAKSRPGTAADTPPSHLDLYEPDMDLEGVLTESQDQERHRVETELGQIESRLQDRAELHNESGGKLAAALRDERDRLERLQRPFPPEDRVTSQRRQIRELERQLHDVERAHWRDCEQLQRERRRLHRKLTELSDTDLSPFF